MANHLPPGQFEIDHLPRFGVTKFANRFPQVLDRVELSIIGAVERPLDIAMALQRLPRIEQVSDFHCVTTWSRIGLQWSGWRFKDVLATIIRPEARPHREAKFIILRGQDGARSSLPLEDLTANDVLLADRLNGAALSVANGAPLRLVVPAHYGYKSVKHLNRIEFCLDDRSYRPSALWFMDHPRARVAFEERGRGVPGWLLRYPYRLFIHPTIQHFERAQRDRMQHTEKGDTTST